MKSADCLHMYESIDFGVGRLRVTDSESTDSWSADQGVCRLRSLQNSSQTRKSADLVSADSELADPAT